MNKLRVNYNFGYTYDLEIPRIIHQSWKSKDLPNKFNQWSRSWTEKNPGWVSKLWSDDENAALVKETVPWFWGTYSKFPKHIQKVDAVRYICKKDKFYVLSYNISILKRYVQIWWYLCRFGL